ncbi:MAG: PKD domain-containing protein, partial [Verrucomicrobia subdivision 3 bacterium]|nr:PKD domain-containing protein [Limisphaerales bacterium]
PAGGPKDFDIVVRLQQPFIYNPAAGNLLLEVQNSGTPIRYTVDAVGGGDGASRVIALNPNARTAITADSGADVLGIVYQTVSPPPPPPVDYNLSRDFSGSSNPNGPWSYGWKASLAGAFALFTHSKINIAGNGVPIQVWDIPDFVPVIQHNATMSTAFTDGGQGSYPPGTTWFFPGSEGYPQNYCVVRFTVPNGQSGTYHVATTVRPAFDGPIQGDTDFHVLRNEGELFGRELPAGSSADFRTSLALAAGDTIEFVIGRGLDDSFHGSGLKIEATLDLIGTNQPPPPPPPTADYDLARDFSTNSNPNGVWSYGWESTLGGAFTLLTHAKLTFSENGVPIEYWEKAPPETVSVYHNDTTNTATSGGGAELPPGTVWYYPGIDGRIDNFGVIRFTAPPAGAGTYALDVRVSPVYHPDVQRDTDFHVLRNGMEIYGVALNGPATAHYSTTLALAAGDTIDFAIGRGADGSLNYSGLKIQATLDLVGAMPPPPLLVVPNGLESHEGGAGASTLGERLRLQEVYHSADFPSEPIRITELRFRPSAVVHDAPYSYVLSNIVLKLSTTQRQPDGLSRTFADNVGPDETVAYSGVLPIQTHFTGPAGGPKDFDIIVRLQQPFIYDPAAGNLLLDVQNSGTPIRYTVDAVGAPDGASRVIALDPNAATAITADSGADVLGIVYQPVTGGAPIARAVVSPLIDLSPKLSDLLIVSPNGTNAVVTLDASQSSDPDGDALAYAWFANGDPAPIATTVNTTVALELGSHEITLVVSDGGATDRHTVEVEVVTVDEVIDILTVLVEEAALARKNQRPLINALKLAKGAAAEDRVNVAVNSLQSFQNKVAAQVAPINQEYADALIDAAQQVIDALDPPAP